MKAKKKLPLFDKIILILNIFAVAVLLLSYLAPGTDPRDWWIVAILGFGYHLLFLTNVLFIVYWSIRLKLFALISLAGILIGFPVIRANYGFNGNAGDNLVPSAGIIRMMTYNIRKFDGVGRFDGEPIESEITKIVDAQQPDIISFEEYRLKIPDQSGVSDSLKKVLKPGYSYFRSFKSSNRDSSGNAIFSKFPIINAGIIPSPNLLKTRAIFVDIKSNNKIVRIYSIHLAAVDIKIEDKARMMKGKVDAGKSDFIIAKLKLAFIMRSYDVSRIKRHMEDCPYPLIVAGDFNDTPNSFAVNEIGDGLKNTFVEKGSGFVTTYYSTFPKLQIDYVFVSPQFNVINYRTIERQVSDHKAIVTDLRLLPD